MKNFKNIKKSGRGKEVVEKPTTSHTPGETPAPLADLAALAPNSVQFQTLTPPFTTSVLLNRPERKQLAIFRFRPSANCCQTM